jgi:hypothetical protein
MITYISEFGLNFLYWKYGGAVGFQEQVAEKDAEQGGIEGNPGRMSGRRLEG